MSVNNTRKTRNLKPFKPGNPGRPKGIPNKFTSLKQSFLNAFEKTGGTQGLITWVNKNPRNRGEFYKMITKLLPQDTNVSGDVKVDAKLIIEVVKT